MMKIKNWRGNARGNVLGFFTVDLENGIELNDFKLVSGTNGNFVSPPQRQFTDRDGNIKYANVVYVDRKPAGEILKLAQAVYNGAANPGPPPPTDKDDIPF